jgi:hypothetical protein
LRDNPAYAVISTSVKPERQIAMMKDTIAQMFMTESNDNINMFVLSQRANLDNRNNRHYRDMYKRTERRARVFGSAPEDLNWRNVTEKMARQILKPGFFSRILKIESRRRTEGVLSAIQANRIAIGQLLQATLSNDPVFRAKIVSEALTGKKAPTIGERGVSSFADTQTEKNTTEADLNPDTITARIKDPEYRRAFRDRNGRTWEQSNERDREAAFFDSYEREAAQKETRKGWFARFLGFIFNIRVREAREQLAAKHAFA